MCVVFGHRSVEDLADFLSGSWVFSGFICHWAAFVGINRAPPLTLYPVFSCWIHGLSPGVVYTGSLSHCHGLLGHFGHNDDDLLEPDISLHCYTTEYVFLVDIVEEVVAQSTWWLSPTSAVRLSVSVFTITPHLHVTPLAHSCFLMQSWNCTAMLLRSQWRQSLEMGVVQPITHELLCNNVLMTPEGSWVRTSTCWQASLKAAANPHTHFTNRIRLNRHYHLLNLSVT